MSSGSSNIQELWNGFLVQTGPRKANQSCKCYGGIPRAQSMGDGTDMIENAGLITRPFVAQAVETVQQQTGPNEAFGPLVKIPRYPSGAITGSVPIDKRTLNYTYGVV